MSKNKYNSNYIKKHPTIKVIYQVKYNIIFNFGVNEISARTTGK